MRLCFLCVDPIELTFFCDFSYNNAKGIEGQFQESAEKLGSRLERTDREYINNNNDNDNFGYSSV